MVHKEKEGEEQGNMCTRVWALVSACVCVCVLLVYTQNASAKMSQHLVGLAAFKERNGMADGRIRRSF